MLGVVLKPKPGKSFEFIKKYLKWATRKADLSQCLRFRPLFAGSMQELRHVAKNSSNALPSADFSLNYQVTIVDRHIGS